MIRNELIESVGTLVQRHAQARPDKVAYRDAGSSVTYGQLAESTANLAGHLEALGVAVGDSVALCLPSSVAWVECCFATVRAGAVCVPISHDATEPEIAYRLDDAACRVIITTADRVAAMQSLAASVPIIVANAAEQYGALSFERLRSTPAGQAPRDPATIDEPSFIVYTSGTTGRAKGVLLSQRSMLWVTAACWAPIAGLNENDTLLSPLPLFHSYALNLSVLSVLAVGASETILQRFSSSDVLALLKTGEFTVFPGVPTMFHYLLEAARMDPECRFPKLRLCLSAGAIMPAAINAEFEQRFGVMLLDGYGITETSTMVTLNWTTGARVMGSCGLPLPGLSTRIVDPISGDDVVAGAEGELIVRGPNVMLGYHRKPAETESVLRNGWYYTGDLARADKHGFLTITGRLKEVIIRGGQNIAPSEVEEAVSSFASVLDCAVVGAPHPHLGEVPVVFVTTRPGKEMVEADLIAHCRAQISAYKLPAAVYVVHEIPRTGSGKVMRYRLREKLEMTKDQ
ncbi:long-chain acyl-CoA synthetase [Massilia sp. UYP11]|uniref:class I adenylate-forming enzyme family protein n=1 Tax=Massilia sp. UYP11 TaxID=1756385 RepID=UPI003D22F4AE